MKNTMILFLSDSTISVKFAHATADIRMKMNETVRKYLGKNGVTSEHKTPIIIVANAIITNFVPISSLSL